MYFSILLLEESTRTMRNVQLDQNFVKPYILLPFLLFYTFIASLNHIDLSVGEGKDKLTGIHTMNTYGGS
jgi:hypothetical protein